MSSGNSSRMELLLRLPMGLKLLIAVGPVGKVCRHAACQERLMRESK